jgi:hypothetical protein
MLERLRAVEWAGDWDVAFGHVKSRRVLFREYLRRAAVWSQTYPESAAAWPFYDITAYAAPEFRLSDATEAELTELLARLPNGEVRTTCAGAVRLAEFNAHNPAAFPDLPDRSTGSRRRTSGACRPPPRSPRAGSCPATPRRAVPRRRRRWKWTPSGSWPNWPRSSPPQAPTLAA